MPFPMSIVTLWTWDLECTLKFQDSDEDWKTCVGGGLKGEDFAGKDLRVGPLVDGNIHAFSICS